MNFWETVDRWGKKGWELALHGCYHKYTTDYLEKFLVSNANDFTKMQNIPLRKRSKSVLDIFLEKLYFIRRR